LARKSKLVCEGEKMKRISGLALIAAAISLVGFAPSTFAQGSAPAPATQLTTTPAANRRGGINARRQI
jgi:hypothetical protein